VVRDARVTGDYRQFHALTLTVDGPASSDSASNPNPFLDFRFQLEVKTPSGKTLLVPGYFAGDGNGGGQGNKWRAHIYAAEAGEHQYRVLFRAGAGVAIDLAAGAGAAMPPDGLSGKFSVAGTDKQAPDFRATGRIVYAGDHYLRTHGDGKVWIKGGVDSPEDLLGYAGFANTEDRGGLQRNFLHRFAPHVADWKAGDPDWGNGAGKGIIGALNYLASARINSIYFMTCNIGGDGDNTWPYTSYTDRTHFDNVKLHQWEIVFSHADKLGIALHVVLSETENDNMHDGGALGPQRKIYYRELVARFGHHGGVFWNIGEENDNSTEQRKAFADFIRTLDPWRSAITVHTHANAPERTYPGLLGDKNYELTSLQLSSSNTNSYVETWRRQSAMAGRPWVVMLDEQTPAGIGLSQGRTLADPGNAPALRKDMLWPALLSGAGGIEWYFGYQTGCSDVNCEDFRSRSLMYQFTWVARQFVERLPVHEMQPADALLRTGGQVFHKKGAVYALYLPNGGAASLDLSGDTGAFKTRFYSVIDGKWADGPQVTAGGLVSLPAAPFPGDVAVVLER
jgi:hypothetical protein